MRDKKRAQRQHGHRKRRVWLTLGSSFFRDGDGEVGIGLGDATLNFEGMKAALQCACETEVSEKEREDCQSR